MRHSKNMDRSSLSLRGVVIFFFFLIMVTPSTVCAEENQSVILAAPDQVYTLTLSSNSSSTVILNFRFNASLPSGEQLKISNVRHADITVTYDPQVDDYTLTDSTDSAQNNELCKIKFIGYQTVLLNERRAELSITSQKFHIQVGVSILSEDLQQNDKDPVIPLSFVIILSLCSLLPVLLLIPDAIALFREQIDSELADSNEVYGRIFAIFIPLLCIALTFLLLQFVLDQSTYFFGSSEVVP